MIESITIKNIATYAATPEVLTGLSLFNYLFGSNGTGKTTISRIIADESKYLECDVKWTAGTKLQPMVYNPDFVERNFNPSVELKGVFTLGEKQLNTLARITSAKEELDGLTTKIEKLTLTLEGVDGAGGKKGELLALETRLKDKCWALKQKHDTKLQGGFEGYRNDSKKFKSKILKEQAANTSKLLTLAELEKKSESVFDTTPTIEVSVPTVDGDILLSHETAAILKKRVIGKEDVDISAIIKKLGNSDWVREGRTFYDVNDEVCPFCQQETTNSFAQSLNEYFDETFVAESKAIDELTTNYASDAARFQQQVAAIITSPSKFFDLEKLKVEQELLRTKITLNNQRLAGKKGAESGGRVGVVKQCTYGYHRPGTRR